jgi:hypothetical protein
MASAATLNSATSNARQSDFRRNAQQEGRCAKSRTPVILILLYSEESD